MNVPPIMKRNLDHQNTQCWLICKEIAKYLVCGAISAQHRVFERHSGTSKFFLRLLLLPEILLIYYSEMSKYTPYTLQYKSEDQFQNIIMNHFL
jgi:hypothetical protein